MVDNVYRAKVPYSRKNVLIRDGHTCQYCGTKIDITLDHIDSNGATDLTNLVLSCRSCNSKKRTKNVFSFCRDIGIEVPKIITQIKQSQSHPIH